MSRFLAGCLLTVAAGIACGPSVNAQSAAPHSVRQAEPAPAVTFVIPPRANPYDVWQNLAVDRYGRFRPRVILAPQGAYYRYSGEHYPWTATRTLEVMPYLVD